MKYEEAKSVKRLKARTNHSCCNCGKVISVGDFYFKESIAMMKPPNLVLKEYCDACGNQEALKRIKQRSLKQKTGSDWT